ncbi:hypothetical protein DWF00_05605 [Bosea caraganae]|uniref:DUF2306 domain-containing protein n=1 Tax=Bosea caraganae TaxID=2763117 RepID=A0A370L340_9HYPH|nr:hypothetical protein [Bosea caraganae]RDJ22844.1 hypothetical protein DWE98_16850 [Bosea caraganae]RDJ28623.1 hypothetical protein DWF00_05605 [Bosea caraganae]
MFDPTTLTGFHTWLSLIAILAGFFVVPALLKGHTKPGWTGTFLSTAFATSATGFALPASGILPSHIFGVVSILLLVPAGYGLYARMLEGPWRRIYAICVVIAHYLLCFVGVFQAFLKAPALHALAPTQSEPPFAIAQGALFVAFAVLTYLAARRFPAGPQAA